MAVDNSCAIPPVPSMYERHRIQPVILVPILAPMIIPMAWATFIIPAFTNPTTITVVAEEDCIMAVTTVPSSIPLRGVFVSLYRISSSFSPAAFFNPSPIRVIPNKNKATPLNNDKMSDIPSISLFSFSLLCISAFHYAEPPINCSGFDRQYHKGVIQGIVFPCDSYGRLMD